jgi:hypothetical protein
VECLAQTLVHDGLSTKIRQRFARAAVAQSVQKSNSGVCNRHFRSLRIFTLHIELAKVGKLQARNRVFANCRLFGGALMGSDPNHMRLE